MNQEQELYIMPLTLAQANGFAGERHKNFRPLRGHTFSIGCAAGGKLAGAAIVGRPMDKDLNDGLTLAVNYIFTTGGRRAYGMLYGASARAAKAMSYWRIVAYLPEDWPSSSLRAAGWRYAGPVESGRPLGPKRLRYEMLLGVRHQNLEELST